jgi:kynurenine 3-monooxygenase
MKPKQVTIVGAGLTGPLLALMLARRGFSVTLCERRPDPRIGRVEAGRSINLALSARGIRPLERAGVYAEVEPRLIPLRGRLVHERSGEPALQPYGQRAGEVIYSVGRAELNRVLIEAAGRAGAELRFAQRCLGLDPAGGHLLLQDEQSGRKYDTVPDAVIAADGAGSTLRATLEAAGAAAVRIEPLDHGYKEMTLPPAAGRHVLEPGALHIWPRGGFMLIALPNPDGSFTMTLFLAHQGEQSFTALAEDCVAERFFTEQFPDLRPYLPHLLGDFCRNPEGRLATVHTAGWHLGGKALLLGDAAHAIVPFHGQGMNAGFEDCALFDDLLEQCDGWEEVFRRFERLRRPDTEAIAQMALENYLEMRDSVRDPGFLQRKRLAFALEKRFPDRFIPRYSMVMFHPEISYLEALRRGQRQLAILEELDRRRTPSGGIDCTLAQALVRERLPSLGS